MEINLSEDASKLSNSFKPEKGIFSEGDDLENILITEFTDSRGFVTGKPTVSDINVNIPLKSLLANGFKLLHEDLSGLKVIGVVTGAGYAASSLFERGVSGSVSLLAGSLGEALGRAAGGVASGIANSLQDLGFALTDPDIQAIKKEGLIAYNKAFYDPEAQEIAAILPIISKSVGAALGNLAGGIIEGIGDSIQDIAFSLEDDSEGGDVLDAEARSRSIRLTKKYGLLKYAEIFYDPASEKVSAVLSAAANHAAEVFGELAGGLLEGIFKPIADIQPLLGDDSSGGDVLDTEARSRSIYLTRKYGLLKYAEVFYNPSSTQVSGVLSAVANDAADAAGNLAGGLVKGMITSLADVGPLLEDDSNGGDVLDEEARSRSIHLTRKYGLLKYAEVFYSPASQGFKSILSTAASGIGQIIPDFFRGIVEGTINAVTDITTLLTDPDIELTKKKGMQTYIETLYGEDAMREKAELALSSSAWASVGSGVVQGFGDFVNTGLDVVQSWIDNLIPWFKKSTSEISPGSQVPILQVESNEDYTTPLNTISRASNLISSNVIKILNSIGGSQTSTLEAKLNDLSTRIYELNERIGSTLSQPPVPTEFRTVDIEA